MEQKQLKVEADKCHIILNIPVYLTDATIPQLRKMFALICRYGYQNEQTIQAINSSMSEILEHLKADWANKSRIFQTEYKYLTYDYSKTRKQAAAIRANNKSLMADVKSAKKTYERFQKIIALWNETKNKYNVKEN